MTSLFRPVVIGLGLLGAVLSTSSLGADWTGFDWATIGDPGNAGYDRSDPTTDPINSITGRGSIGYGYRVSTTEISSGQWVEFLNTFGDHGDPHDAARDIFASGIERDRSYSGPGRRWKLLDGFEEAERIPVLGISWFNAARYCNWLHHGQTTDLDKLEYGAYDLRDVVDNIPPERSEGARYWIPTFDEYLKAAYYDPNRFGEGQGGWWEQPNGSDTELIVGAPSDGGQTNAGISDLDVDATSAEILRLGAYVDVTSPWGLLDVSGGGSEWVDGPVGSFFFTYRYRMGSSAIVTLGDTPTFFDAAYAFQAGPAWAAEFSSFRVAALVPTPASAVPLLVLFTLPRKRSWR